MKIFKLSCIIAVILLAFGHNARAATKTVTFTTACPSGNNSICLIYMDHLGAKDEICGTGSVTFDDTDPCCLSCLFISYTDCCGVLHTIQLVNAGTGPACSPYMGSPYAVGISSSGGNWNVSIAVP